MDAVINLAGFVSSILERAALRNHVVTYREHSDQGFTLRPSIFRTSLARENEHILLRELIAAHPEDFTSDSSALELLVRMQHFSLPTRLLDVTFNPLVALYFACELAKRRAPTVKDGKRTTRSVATEGQVVILSVPKGRVRYFDSDTVSCLANLARLKYELKIEIDTTLEVKEFNASLPIKRLLHFIRQEKNGFEPEIKPTDINDIILVRPKQNNRRILAQSGAFFVFGERDEIVATDNNIISIARITVAADAKQTIRDELDKLGINEKTLFPEIERAARYLTGNISTQKMVSRLV
jgi:hypothetical protein